MRSRGEARHLSDGSRGPRPPAGPRCGLPSRHNTAAHPVLRRAGRVAVMLLISACAALPEAAPAAPPAPVAHGAGDSGGFHDVLRHVGRAELSSFAGGAPSNRLLDREIWQTAPYTEADLQRQVTQSPPGFAKPAAKLRADLYSYVDGINRYIAEARVDPNKMPGEYAAIDQPLGPADWKPTDTVAVATLVGAISGAGGVGELPS